MTTAAIPLLLLPGTLCDERVWAPMREALASSSTATRVEIHTAALHGQRSAAAMAAALLATMPPRCAIAGFSLGGIVALEMAAQAPARVLGLALIATNARPDVAGNAERRRAGVARARLGGVDAHVTGDLLPRYFARAQAGNTALQIAVRQMAIDTRLGAYADQAEIAIVRADSRPRLPRITVPVLIVGGDEDAINPRDTQEEMACALPQAEWTQVKNAGHFVPFEAPGELAELVARWLQRLAL